MKRIISLILTVVICLSIFTTVSAQENIIVLNENYGKVKITSKIQISSNPVHNGSIVYSIRARLAESKDKDVLNYIVKNENQHQTAMTAQNPSFDFAHATIIDRDSTSMFKSGTVSGGDNRSAIVLKTFGEITATHGMTCAVIVTSTSHNLSYSTIGNVYKDEAGIEWVLLRVSNENTLVFVSKELEKGTETNPTFYNTMTGDLTNTANADDKITVDSYKNKQQLRPSYKMTSQEIYVVNGEEITLVSEIGKEYEGDYIIAKEEYSVKNPVYVASTIIEQRPDGGYTENPNLAVGQDLLTVKNEYYYYADGSINEIWDVTFHKNLQMSWHSGLHWGIIDANSYHYLPGTKPFYATNKNTSGKVVEENAYMNFSNLWNSIKCYPDITLNSEYWANPDVIPSRRMDFILDTETNKFAKVFAGGILPEFDGVNEIRKTITDKSHYMYRSRKCYFHFANSKMTSGITDTTNLNYKGAGYKTYVSEYDENALPEDLPSTYHSVPFYGNGEKSRYMYFDIFKPGTVNKYDVSAYLNTYTISEIEKTENLEYSIDYNTGVLTVSSKNNNQNSADTLVLKVKYVGESIPAVENLIRNLPEVYEVSLNEKLADIAAMMEKLGEPESEYSSDVILKYKSLLKQKEDYEKAVENEATEAERIENLSKNLFYNVDMNKYGKDDLFVWDADFLKKSGNAQFGYNNVFLTILNACTAVDKIEGDIEYKEYYSKDNLLYAVYDVANDTYYYNSTDTTYKQDAYEFLGNKYTFKYIAGTTKTYYGILAKNGTTKTSTSCLPTYAWYHNGDGPYLEMSELAKNKVIIDTGTGTLNADTIHSLLAENKEFTVKDLITGNDITGETGTLTAGETKFIIGPFAPEKSATYNGVLLDEEEVTLPFGEDAVKADYINLLASTYVTSSNLNTSFATVTVDYENKDGSIGQKHFAIILAKTGDKKNGVYNSTVQEITDNSIFKVEKTKTQNSYSTINSNKEATSGVKLENIKFNTKSENIIIYPTEIVKTGSLYTRHSWTASPADTYAAVYKIPVYDLYKVKSITVNGNSGGNGYVNNNKSDFYIQGSYQSSNAVAIPVEVTDGDENYNYYAMYSPTQKSRAVLYGANAQRKPLQPEIDNIEELMKNASSIKDIAEIEKLYTDLISDGAVKEKDFDTDILSKYNELKEKSDINVIKDEFSVILEDDKVVINIAIANPTKLPGKPYMVIVPFYKGDELITTKFFKFTSSQETEIRPMPIIITDIPEETTNVKGLIWRDFKTIKPIEYFDVN